jgi:hypothetical protein
MTRGFTAGWVAVGLSSLVSCVWAFWGVTENFHEGWFSPSLAQNLLWTLAYLSGALLWMSVTLCCIRWPRAGGILTIMAGLALGVLVMSSRQSITPGTVLNWLPMLGGFGVVGLLWWFGAPRPRALAYGLTVAAPLLVMLACAVEPIYRIAHRSNDGFKGMRLVTGNGVELMWAPAGPGWPSSGVRLEEAQRRCRYLNADGTQLAGTPQEIWRLPSVEEVVRSLTRAGRNAQGSWDVSQNRPVYGVRPDKETPLWDPQSKVVYWWTSSGDGQGRYYRVVYNGRVDAKPATYRMGNLAFRAVRTPSREERLAR